MVEKSKSVSEESKPRKEADPMVRELRQVREVTKVDPPDFLKEEMGIVKRVMNYMMAMTPNRMVTAAEASHQQKQLFATLLLLLSVNRERFPIMMGWFLKVVQTSRSEGGVFSDRYIARCYSHMDLPAARLKAYSRLLNLLLIASGVNDKSILARRVDLDALLESFQDKEIKEKLLLYFAEGD